MDNSNEPSIESLRSAIQLACQPQNAHRVVAGRRQVLAMPRSWVLQTIEKVASECLNLSDYWEYRRLLELASHLDANLLQRLVQLGQASDDEDVREAARDFQVD
jgi:hypothetical protein